MTTEMFDSIDPSQIPPGQDAAGYVDGRWPTFKALHGPHNLSIAVYAADDADALDVETGDATNSQAAAWVKRELSLGHRRPCVYTSISNVAALLSALRAGGVDRSQIRLWTAHYTFRSHICTDGCYPGLAAGFQADATQWTDQSGGRNLDESTVCDGFFDPPPPCPILEDYMKLVEATNPATNVTAQYLIRCQDVLHVPDGTCSQWAYSEFNGGQGTLEAVPWEIILWLNNGQTPG